MFARLVDFAVLFSPMIVSLFLSLRFLRHEVRKRG